MAGRVAVDSVAVDLIHPLGQEVRQLGRAAEGDIGVVGRMHRLSPRVVVESAEAILVLVVVTAIAIGSETVIVTAMEDGLGMRGIGVHRFLGENRRLHEHRGVTGIGHLRIDGRHPGLGLGLGLVRHHRGGGGR
jgi:hypothetical protein